MPRSNPGLLLPVATLWRREMVRFFRQRSRIIGSFGTPLLFWLLLSSGLGPSFRPPGDEVGAYGYFFPGALALILLFTSIFANISVIEDRREGFLQGVLVAPIPRIALVLGKILGGATIAALQAAVLFAMAALGGLELGNADPLGVVAAILTVALAISALGFGFAWWLNSVQGFHGIMNLLLMPMWVLSGALFPASGLPPVMKALFAANPMVYGLAWIRHALGSAGGDLPGLSVSVGVTAAFAAVSLAFAVLAIVRKPV
ncbi:MAG: ABC transporter permease [Gemmatimonadetes bacterium]|nr:ABC transporter permease [Gemmatimonadota bacterium]